MVFYQFKLLEKEEQLPIVEEKGVFLAEHVEGDYTFKLFRIDLFYVEEQWHTTFNERRNILPFMSEEKLRPYLKAINQLSSVQ